MKAPANQPTSLLTLEEIARKYDLPLHLVRKASSALQHRYAYGKVESGGPRLHSPAAIQAIRKHVEKAQACVVLRSTDEAAVFWQGLAALATSAGQLSRLSRELQDLAGHLNAHFKGLRRSTPTVTAFIYTLPDPTLLLPHPIAVLIKPLRKVYWRASLAEAGLTGSGRSQEGATLDLRETILREYLKLRDAPLLDPERWRVLSQLIRREKRLSGRLK